MTAKADIGELAKLNIDGSELRLQDMPVGIIQQHILSHLSLKEIINLSCCSKALKSITDKCCPMPGSPGFAETFEQYFKLKGGQEDAKDLRNEIVEAVKLFEEGIHDREYQVKLHGDNAAENITTAVEEKLPGWFIDDSSTLQTEEDEFIAGHFVQFGFRAGSQFRHPRVVFTIILGQNSLTNKVYQCNTKLFFDEKEKIIHTIGMNGFFVEDETGGDLEDFASLPYSDMLDFAMVLAILKYAFKPWIKAENVYLDERKKLNKYHSGAQKLCDYVDAPEFE